MPGGTTIIFAGKTRAKAASQLYTVGIDASGLQQVTQNGGSSPAPCADGRVIYSRGPNLYVLSASLKRSRRFHEAVATAQTTADRWCSHAATRFTR